MSGEEANSICLCFSSGSYDELIQLLDEGLDPNTADCYGNSILHHAVANPDPNVTRLLLGRGANVDAINMIQETVLYDACAYGTFEVIKILVEHGAKVNRQETVTFHSFQALHAAAWNQDLEVVKYLMENGGKLIFGDLPVRTPVWFAATGGKVSTVEYFVAEGASLTDPDYRGSFIIHEACTNNQMEVVEYLLQNGINVNSRNQEGNTPLHMTCAKGLLEFSKLLLSRGANINAMNNEGATPLHEACSTYFLCSKLVEFLIDKGAMVDTRMKDGSAPLHSLATSGMSDEVLASIEKLLIRGAVPRKFCMRPIYQLDNPAVETLVKYGLDVNVLSDTSLWFEMSYDLAKLLIGKGANINLKRRGRDTFLTYAIKRDREDLVDLVIKAGGDLSSTIADACDSLQMHFVEKFISLGVDPNEVSMDGILPLNILVKKASKDEIEPLLHSGWDVNVFDVRHQTPLHCAVKRDNNEEILKLLLSHGADVKALNFAKKTPLHRATRSPLYVKMLLEQGSDANATDVYGRSPLHYACIHNNAEGVQELINSLADIYLRDNKNESVLEILKKYKNCERVQCLKASGIDINILSRQATEEEEENQLEPWNFCVSSSRICWERFLEEHLVERMHINSCVFGEKHSIFLHMFIHNEPNITFAKELIEMGADVTAADGNGRNSLHYAAYRGSFPAVKFLIKHCRELNTADANGLRPIFYCSDLDATKLLLVVTPDVQPEELNRALGYSYRSPKFTRKLLSLGADVNVVMPRLRTPLHYSAKHGDVHTIRALLANGADVDARDDQKHTPLYYGAWKGHYDVVRLLVARGANPYLPSHMTIGHLTRFTNYDISNMPEGVHAC